MPVTADLAKLPDTQHENADLHELINAPVRAAQAVAELAESSK